LDSPALNLFLSFWNGSQERETMKNCVTMFSSFLLALFLFLPSPALADTYYVPDDFTTIQGALDSAVGGDTIIVRDGTYVGIGNRNLDFGGKALTVRSENGPANCTINGSGTDRGFKFHNGETYDSVVDGFTFIGCHPASDGGAIWCDASSPTITNCIFSGNISNDCGPGIRCTNNASPEISNCTFTGNTASEYGGGIYCNASSPTIINCTFSENESTRGGAIYCVFSSSPEIVNCTFSENTANIGGGVCAFSSSSPTITNCILWDNSATSGHEIALSNSSSASVSYCDVEGGQLAASVGKDSTLDWGAGNIDEDPLFEGGGDYHISLASPCVDAGTDVAIYVDIDGDIRPQDAGYEIGSDEVSRMFYVPDDYPTIKAAIQGVFPDSVIIVRDGVYTGSANRNLSFGGKALTLMSENGPANCIIDCENIKGGFVF
jgi:parallel beta-helix repeat protein